MTTSTKVTVTLSPKASRVLTALAKREGVSLDEIIERLLINQDGTVDPTREVANLFDGFF